MKLTSDLDEANVKKEIENAIGAKARELLAQLVEGMLEEILATKMVRLTPDAIDKLAKKAVEERVKQAFESPNSCGTTSQSLFKKVLTETTEKLIRENLCQKKS